MLGQQVQTTLIYSKHSSKLALTPFMSVQGTWEGRGIELQVAGGLSCQSCYGKKQVCPKDAKLFKYRYSIRCERLASCQGCQLHQH